MSASPPGQTPSPGADSKHNGERRSSFNFLRRQKSGETASRKTMGKKQKAQLQQQQQAQSVPRVPPQLPSHSPLPKINSFGGENARPDSYAIVSNNYHVSGTHAMPYSSPPHGVPIPPIPSSSPGSKNGEQFDPYARTESMTHRGRYSYASSAISTSGINSPRRVRRRKDPTPFNILVIGAKNCGKTSFIDFLRSALLLPSRKREKTPSPPRTALPPDSPFTPHYLETEVDHERIGVTLWDSQGLEKKFVDLQLREMSSFLESKFEETFTEEQKVVRAPGVRDTHIHCVFLILDPTRLDANLAHARKPYQPASKFDEPLRLMGILDEDLDVQVLKTLQGKTTVIPVISKADTITTTHMAQLKKAVWESLKQAKLDPLEALNLAEEELDEEDEDRLDERDEDAYMHSADEQGHDASDIIDNLIDRSSSEEEREPKISSPPTSPSKAERSHQRSPSSMERSINNGNGNDNETPYVPMSIISPDSYEPGVVGRRFPWGFADPYNVEHCDFVRLKDSVFSEWRAELREASREVWYEGWRTSRLKKREKAASLRGTTPRPSQGQYRQSPAVQMLNPGSPEMIRGHYRQGVNAF